MITKENQIKLDAIINKWAVMTGMEKINTPPKVEKLHENVTTSASPETKMILESYLIYKQKKDLGYPEGIKRI